MPLKKKYTPVMNFSAFAVGKSQIIHLDKYGPFLLWFQQHGHTTSCCAVNLKYHSQWINTAFRQNLLKCTWWAFFFFLHKQVILLRMCPFFMPHCYSCFPGLRFKPQHLALWNLLTSPVDLGVSSSSSLSNLYTISSLSIICGLEITTPFSASNSVSYFIS